MDEPPSDFVQNGWPGLQLSCYQALAFAVLHPIFRTKFCCWHWYLNAPVHIHHIHIALLMNTIPPATSHRRHVRFRLYKIPAAVRIQDEASGGAVVALKRLEEWRDLDDLGSRVYPWLILHPVSRKYLEMQVNSQLQTECLSGIFRLMRVVLVCCAHHRGAECKSLPRFYQFYHIYLDIFISAFLDILWVPKILYGVVLIMNDLCSQQVTWFQKGNVTASDFAIRVGGLPRSLEDFHLIWCSHLGDFS